MSREIADENWDFRDGIDEEAEAEDFRLDSMPERKAKAGAKLTREQVNTKKGMRLPSHLRAYMVFEIISTNKTGRAIARKFGVAESTVAEHKTRIIRDLVARGAKILYRKNGELFFK